MVNNSEIILPTESLGLKEKLMAFQAHLGPLVKSWEISWLGASYKIEMSLVGEGKPVLPEPAVVKVLQICLSRDDPRACGLGFHCSSRQD